MDYKKKYLKYKNKYQLSKNKQSGGYDEYPPKFDTLSFNSEIDKIKYDAHKSAYDLLIKIHSLKKTLKIATAESLTAGLIFSTLVDIPFGGAYKYGCFGVYDTDAKRVFLNVKVDDVYTHKCAKEMAIGILKNSNASIGIAVTGNAMPYKNNEKMIGEVFIGIAGYTNENTITVSTNVYNFCSDKSTCKLWHDTPHFENKLNTLIHNYKQNNNINIPNKFIDGYNDLQITSMLSMFIRYQTANQAYIDCVKFIDKYNPIIPKFINNNLVDYQKINYVDDSSNNRLLSYPTLIINCESNVCNDDKRVHNAEYK